MTQASSTSIHRDEYVVVHPRPYATSPGRFVGILLAGITLLALALRVDCLDCSGLWQDEYNILRVALLQQNLGTAITTSTPLYSALVWLTSRIADPHATALFLRLPSALAGAITPVFVYALGRELFGWKEGLTAALLTAFSAVLIDRSQEMRTYAVLPLLVTIAAYCLVRADRTTKRRWWYAFGAAMAALLLWSNTGAIVVAPTFAPYILYLAWKLAQRQGFSFRILAGLGVLFAGIVTAAARVLASRFAAYDIPHPDITKVGLSDFVFSAFRQVVVGTQFGLGQIDLFLMVGFLLMTLLGVYDGLRRGRTFATIICASAILIPAALLAVFGQVQEIPPRYALFTIVFDFLLVARGLVGLVVALGGHARSSVRRWTEWVPRSTTVALILAPFALGAFLFHTPFGHSRLSYRPDYRGAAQYLATHAMQDDLVIYVGNPEDVNVGAFYLGTGINVKQYSVLDPRLPGMRLNGAIYWVIGDDEDEAPRALSASGYGQPVVVLEHLAIFREGNSVAEISGEIERLGQALHGASLKGWALRRVATSMEGAALQASGRIAEAAAVYRIADITGSDRGESAAWLRNAEGEWRGADKELAWRNGAMARFYQPDAPAVYDWASQMLSAVGDAEQSQRAAAMRDYLNAHP
jgi:hypothetical protein